MPGCTRSPSPEFTETGAIPVSVKDPTVGLTLVPRVGASLPKVSEPTEGLTPVPSVEVVPASARDPAAGLTDAPIVTTSEDRARLVVLGDLLCVISALGASLPNCKLPAVG